MQKTYNKFIAFAIVIILVLSAYTKVQAGSAQVPEWPTDKVVNIINFYKPPENATAAILAKNISTFIHTRGDEAFRDELIANGVTGPILEYMHFESIKDPGSCTHKPFQNQVAYEIGDFCHISKNHPDWFLLDTNGNRINLDINYYMMDPGNQEWREFWLSRTRRAQEELGWYGVFADNVEASRGKLGQMGVVPEKYPTDASYQAAVLDFLKFLYTSYFQPENRPLFANIIALDSTSTWLRYMEYLDGAMDEAWAVDWHTGYISEYDWNDQLNRAEQTQAMGKHPILISQGSRTDPNRQRFAFASYLLISNGGAAFRYADAINYEIVWLFPNYKVDLGKPLGPRYQQGNVWRRDFSKGYVTVDPTSHAASIVKRTTYNEKNRAFIYSAGWQNGTAEAAFLGGYKFTEIQNASVKFTFTGQDFSILYNAGRNYGKMAVFVDGIKVSVIDQWAESDKFQQRWDYTGNLESGKHEIMLKFYGPNTKLNSLDGVIVDRPV